MRRAAAALSVAFALAAAPAPAPAADAADAVKMSRTPLAERDGWRGYVLDSPRPLVYPRTAQAAGSAARVSDPGALGGDDGRAATISRDLLGEGRILVDLGRNVGGRVEIGVSSLQGGPLRVSYSEGAAFLQPGGDMRGKPSLGISDNPEGRSDVATSAGVTASPGIRGAQRYMLLSLDGPGSATIDFVRVKVGHLRPERRDYSGRFLSSSRLLNRIWYAGAYTLNMNAVLDPRRGGGRVIVDGGKRDRLVWIGDLALQSLAGHYAVRQMPALVARSLRSFACQQYASGYIPMTADVHFRCPRDPGPPDGPPPRATIGFEPLFAEDKLPEYTAWWIVAVCDAYRLGGRAGLARRMLPVMRRGVGYVRSRLGRAGLFRTPEGAINWRAFDIAEGTDGHTNATWVRALRRLASVERRLGSASEARRDLSLARRISRAMRRRLFDRRAGLFIANGEAPRANHAQDANVEAILAGVVDRAGALRILRRERDRLWTRFGPLNGDLRDDPYVSRYISPFMSGWELIARLQHHQERPARQLLQRLWGRMLRAGPGTVWEAMSAKGRPVSFGRGRLYPGRTSLSHGWGAAPVYALSAYVGGLRAVAPGWRTWLAEPQRLGLRFAQARVQTPRGGLASRWRVFGRRRAFKLTVRAPRGSRGVAAVPLLGSRRVIARDGRVVWHRGRPVGGVRAWRAGGYVRFAQGPGIRTYSWVGSERRSPPAAGVAARRAVPPAPVTTAPQPVAAAPRVAPTPPPLQGSADGTAGGGGSLGAAQPGGGGEGAVGAAEPAGTAAPDAGGVDRAQAAGAAGVRGPGGVGRVGEGWSDQADGGSP